MKKLICFVAVILIVSLYNKANASHVTGSEITWTCIGQDSFLIKLIVYRDCNGILLSEGPITFKCATSGSTITTLTIPVTTPVDVTPVCISSCSRCQNSGCSFPYGIHRYTMQGIVNLSTAGNCCKIYLSWEQCCRNGSITTGASNMNFYTEGLLNRCENPCDNSPEFSNNQIAILCVGQDFTFQTGAIDYDVNSSGSKLDSLVYEWATPLKANSDSIGYIGQYDYNRPIYFWGFPNDALPFPRGIHLDSTNGDIRFRPMKAEVTVMAIKVKEYRNGNLIAEIRRDIQMFVITCTNNNPPSISTPNNIRNKTVHAGDTVTFTFTTNDPNSNDSLSIIWSNSIPGSSWTTTSGKHPTATLTWVPSNIHAGSLPHTFIVSVNDNACPVGGHFSQAYQIIVLPDTSTGINQNKIEQTDFKIYPNPSYGYVNVVYQGLSKWEGSLLLYDPNSKLMINKPVRFNQSIKSIELPLNGYQPGLYLLKLENQTKTISLKLLVH